MIESNNEITQGGDDYVMKRRHPESPRCLFVSSPQCFSIYRPYRAICFSFPPIIYAAQFVDEATMAEPENQYALMSYHMEKGV